MSKFGLAACLCLLVAPLVASERRPLRAALDQVFDAVLDVVAPVSPVLGDSTCRRQGLLYRQAVKEGRAWALHMLDAGAKIPSGLLLHNLVQLGNFDECLAVRHSDPELGEIEGQHCQVSVGALTVLSASSLFEASKIGANTVGFLDLFDTLLQQRNHSAAFEMLGGSWALCVPAACSASELQLHLRTVLPALPVRVVEQACTSRADAVPVWDWQSLLAIVLLSFLGALLLVGTVYDLATLNTSGKPRHHSLIAFSLYNNGRLLFCADNPTSSDHLTSMHGIRSLSMMAIVFAHCCAFNIGSPLANITELMRERMQSMLWMPFSNATLHVDTFFVMSGTLMSYSYIRQRERGTKFSLSKFYLNRYLRVAPVHFVTFLFDVAWLPMGIMFINAPRGKAIISTIQEECSNIRWLNLLYISNIFDKGHFCQNVGWSLSIEMQLLLVSPLLLYPLWRRPWLGMSLLGLLSVASTAFVFSVAYEHHLQVISPLSEKMNSPNADLIYFYPHTRCVPWLIGLAVGALLSRRVAPSHRQAALGWCTSVALGYYAMFHANASYQHDFVPDRLHSAIYFALMRPAWALACAWMIFACETGFGGFVHNLLGWQVWQFPSRLCFGMFLSHFVLVGTIPIMMKTVRHYQLLAGLIEFCGIMVLSMVLATVLHLAVEMPCYILGSKYRGSAKEQTGKEQPKKIN